MKASTWLVPLNIHHSLSLRTVAKNSRQLQSISLSLVSLTNSVIAIERSSIELTGTANAILDLLKSEQHKEEAIARLAPTFSFGPMLVEPNSVRLPMPDLMQPVKWSWISHPSISEWEEVPIMQEDGKPNIPNGRIKAWNGWIKLDLDESQGS